MKKVLPAVSLVNLSTQFLNSIHQENPISIEFKSLDEFHTFLPALSLHTLDNLAFLSLPETKDRMRQYYHETFTKQKQVLKLEAAGIIRKFKAVLLQGFTRNTDFDPILPPSNRHDIDVFVHKNISQDFAKDLLTKGFGPYGFNKEGIVELDQDIQQLFKDQYWADKDFALTHIQETNLPEDLPIEIEGEYLPYIKRGSQYYFSTALEPHYSYISPKDTKFIEEGRQYWSELDCDRLDETTTLYFNLLRLTKGVSVGECRLRLVLETACLIAGINNTVIDYEKLVDLVDRGSETRGVKAVCLALSKYHPVFIPLTSIPQCNAEEKAATEWLSKYLKTLILNTA